MIELPKKGPFAVILALAALGGLTHASESSPRQATATLTVSVTVLPSRPPPEPTTASMKCVAAAESLECAPEPLEVHEDNESSCQGNAAGEICWY